jgi:membrane glycosyltransferase
VSGQLAWGLALKKAGLLLTPEETTPPDITGRSNALQGVLAPDGFDEADSLMALYRDPHLREQHEAMLPPAQPRRRGEINAERALAEAKLVDAETIDDAVRWLSPKERMVVLHDRALLDLAMRLQGPHPEHATASANGA